MLQNDDGLKHIFPKDFIQIIDQIKSQIIDIREPFELQQLPFPYGKNVPFRTLITNPSVFLEKERTYYILCHHGQRSYLVTEVLSNNGYNVVNVVGGIDLVNRFDMLQE